MLLQADYIYPAPRQQQMGQEVTAVGSISQSVRTRSLRTCCGTLGAQAAAD